MLQRRKQQMQTQSIILKYFRLQQIEFPDNKLQIQQSAHILHFGISVIMQILLLLPLLIYIIQVVHSMAYFRSSPTVNRSSIFQ